MIYDPYPVHWDYHTVTLAITHKELHLNSKEKIILKCNGISVRHDAIYMHASICVG